MSQNLTISETGLKLIKAFEGFRPVDRELITGQRIVGYGHRLYSEDAVMMNKAEASDVLKSDLEPFEDMINTEVHAPMSQSQFDALCSFAFNIGPKAFLQSDTLRAMNNGRPLDAANGLDIWRKSVIDGKTYVVDALMRRRTAEKALFLRTGSAVPAGREDLPPVKDDIMTGLTTDDGLPVFTESDANGIVATAPYSAYDAPARRREDGPAGALQLSERDIVEEDEFVEEEIFEDGSAEDGLGLDLNLDLDLDLDLGAEESGSFSLPEDNLEDLESLENVEFLKAETSNDAPDAATADEKRKSPIAAAATDIVARLDALIDDADVRFDDTKETWPESLVDTATSDYLDETGDDILSSETTEDGLRNNVIDLNPETSRASDALGETLAQRIMHGREAPLSENNVEVSTIDADETLNNGPVPVIDELAQDDAFRQRSDSAAKYIETSDPAHLEPQKVKQGGAALWMPIIIGFILVGVACGAMFRGSELLLGQWGPIISFTGFVIGAGLILSGIYATLRINLSR